MALMGKELFNKLSGASGPDALGQDIGNDGALTSAADYGTTVGNDQTYTAPTSSGPKFGGPQ
jgi:hypothetical protein